MKEMVLKRIKEADLKGLGIIASEIRERIIEVVSKNGGHLAPSLGVVELAIAIHRVFNSPKDSIIWDVGHQSYPHKIITGRDQNFDTLRKKNGISGFPKRNESVHDHFGTGHSSTSISAALGIAEAKKFSGDEGKTIAVIGDGSLTAGLAYEGLNHAGHVKNKRLIVILNDNQMSIDRNVGALSYFMNKGLTNPTYNRLKRDLKMLLKMVSMDDINLVKLSQKAAMAVKDFFLAGSLFEAFGFRYIGPIDGHNIETMIDTLKNISYNIDNDDTIARPILLHVITKKGKGYVHAEKDPQRFHGIGGFNIEDGSSTAKAGSPTYTAIFGEAVCDLMEMDSRVVAITAAMPTGTGLDAVKDRFPSRYYDVGIAEPHAVTFAAGLATKGLRPIVAIYSSFLQRSYDEIVHDVCLQNLPVIFAIDRAGVVGDDGPTHHGVFDLSYLSHIPNMTIMAPRDENELRKMVFSSVSFNLPVAFRYPRGRGSGLPLEINVKNIEYGKSETIIDPLNSVCAIFAVGNMLARAIKSAEILKEEGVEVSVIDAKFIKPIDEQTILYHAKKGRPIVSIEDNVLSGGYGSLIVETLIKNELFDVPVFRFGYPDEFLEHGSIDELHKKYNLTSEQIAGFLLKKLPSYTSMQEAKANLSNLTQFKIM